MLFLITDVRILSNMKGMDPVMSALIASAVVDPAARNDRNVRAVCDIEIIVYKVCHAGNADDHRDVNFLALCIAINIDIDARLVRLLLDLNMFTCLLYTSPAVKSMRIQASRSVLCKPSFSETPAACALPRRP